MTTHLPLRIDRIETSLPGIGKATGFDSFQIPDVHRSRLGFRH